MNSNKFLLVFMMFFTALLSGQTAKEIIAKSELQMNGEGGYSELKMTIVRPSWTREMTLKSWSLGTDYSLIILTGPARDKGTGFLKRKKEIWNWQPKIDRVIKMPPSMMTQSWMGSDFSNDDLVNQTSPVNDYTHQLMGEEVVSGQKCWKVKMTPKADVAVVWGSVIIWVDQKSYLQMKTEFYDEDDFLVNTMISKNLKQFGKRTLPSILEVIPADKPGEKTIIEQMVIDFDKKQDAAFFSIQNMKRLN